MAFKSIKTIEESINNRFLRLQDEQSIKGVFLYHDYSDVLVADVHYINTKSYKGYVHCCETNCPACQKGIRVQNKLFIPFLVIADLNKNYDEDTVIFWDRNTSFNNQLRKDVFDKYDCPTDVVFSITRHGAFRDINTTYSIQALYRYDGDIDKALDSMGVHFPDYYSKVVKPMTVSEMYEALNDSDTSSEEASMPSETYTYQAKPRKKYVDPAEINDEDVPTSPVKSTGSELPSMSEAVKESEDSNDSISIVDSDTDIDTTPSDIDEDDDVTF